MKEAMEADPNYSSSGGLGQEAAIDAWESVLERDDLSQEQRVFAWWRIGSISAYNFGPEGSSKYDKAREAFGKVLEMGDVVSFETANAASQFASAPGGPHVESKQIAKAFKWVSTQKEKDIEKSAEKVSFNAYLLDAKLFTHSRHETMAEKRKNVRARLDAARKSVIGSIDTQIRYSENPAAIRDLLARVEPYASEKLMNRWRKLYEEMKAGVEGHGWPATFSIVLVGAALLLPPIGMYWIWRKRARG